MKNIKYFSLIVMLGMVLSIAVAEPAFAQMNKGFGRGQMQRLMVVGTVSAINGSTLTVSGKQGFNNPNTSLVNYTVNAANAKITKNNVAGTIASISVGDTVSIQGTISGANITATAIRDGAIMPRLRSGVGVAVQGNGQPVVAGKVTAINGNTISITNSSNVTYTVDATSAKFIVSGVTTPTISNVAVGDNLIVQGTVNGNSVVASSVIDQKAKPSNNAGENENENSQKAQGGFFGGIVNFFKHLFGF
jgi:hypothetical protein